LLLKLELCATLKLLIGSTSKKRLGHMRLLILGALLILGVPSWLSHRSYFERASMRAIKFPVGLKQRLKEHWTLGYSLQELC
jgi:hypothetical protein